MRYTDTLNFKNYIFGYINEYHNFNDITRKLNISYKEQKITRTLNYLNVTSNRELFRKIILFVAKFEVIINIVILFLNFFKYFFKSFFVKKVKVNNCKIVLGIDPSEVYLTNILVSSEIKVTDVIVLKIPSFREEFPNFKKINLLTGVGCKEIFKSFVMSVKIVLVMNKKYSKRDFLFRSYSSLEYFMTCYFIERTSTSNKYIFNNTYDRWAFLFGGLSHETYFIQHGIISDSIRLIKIGSADFACYLNSRQRIICEKLLFKSSPKVFAYRKPFVFNSFDKLINNEKENVLLICNNMYFENEINIINDLTKKNFNLYIKPHPTDDESNYIKLNDDKKFVILGKNEYPKMDFVISYVSTLADDYEINGCIVIRYEDLFKETYSKYFGELVLDTNLK